MAGGFGVVFEAGAGAGGTAGVCAVAGAGVDGAFAVEDEAAGGALGYYGQWLYNIESAAVRDTPLRSCKR